jgi:hypothetical protein
MLLLLKLKKQDFLQFFFCAFYTELEPEQEPEPLPVKSLNRNRNK